MSTKIRSMIEKAGITQTAFARRFGIPLRTVQSWYLNERKCPTYLEKLLESEIERDSNLLSVDSEEIETIKFCVKTSDSNIPDYYDSAREAIKNYNHTKQYAEDEENEITVYLSLYIEYTDGIKSDNIYLLSETV